MSQPVFLFYENYLTLVDRNSWFVVDICHVPKSSITGKSIKLVH
jgi:hypothetical protein